MSTFWSIATFIIATVASGVADQSPSSLTERVDMIELNHFVDENGREVFQQLIFYDWSKQEKRFHVRAWRLVKKPSQLPTRRWNPTLYECVWHDDGVRKMVTSASMRETWSQQDPERVNREFLSEDRRIPLWDSHTAQANGETTSR
ncbi:hypothetical protein [Novipirellula caenicola]|uniref:Secreted protein n=1 Tax=Novipirellula caenicola TaxID=1536901 RepID=A0ABP9W183_9BACT